MMKIPMYLGLVGPLALWTLASCAAPEPQTERVQPTAPAAAKSSPKAANPFWAEASYIVRGNVVDPSGASVAGKVALVSGSGSTSTSVSGGGFELGVYGEFPRTLCAWTHDGRIGWRVLEAPPEGPVDIEVSEDGAFLTLVPGDRSDRVSILSGAVPLHDVKFPAGETRTFVVPAASEISFGTKGMDGNEADRRTARLTPGSATTVSF